MDLMIGRVNSFTTSATTPYFHDSQGRASIFHGTNFVNKEFPWYPPSLLNQSHIQDLKDSGMNAVRLGFMWTGAEPEEGKFNQTYFDIMGGIVDNLSKNGIYTIIDVHQDVISSKYCLYDAAPLWAIDKVESPVHPFPWPLQWDGVNPCPWTRGWSSNYFAEATGKAFDGLYNNHGGFRDSFAAFWKQTVGYFKNKPLIGYEIINEPWAGDIYAQPDLLLPGHAGAKNLLPFYDIIAEAIRSVDASHIVLYEPVTWGMIFNGTILGSGLDRVPGGESWKNMSAYSFHYYCWWLKMDSSEAEKTACDSVFFPKVLHEVSRHLRRVGGAAILSEWGQGCADQISSFDLTDPSTFRECLAIMETADSNFMGWTDWYFGGRMSGDWIDMHSEAGIAPWTIFSRPYARYIAGLPRTMKFDFETKLFHFCYVLDPRQHFFDTEIFVNFELSYPGGYVISTSENIKVTKVDITNHVILVSAVKSTEIESPSKPDKIACLDISPKK